MIEKNIRWVLTFVDKDGYRRLFDPMQGRWTFATYEEAEARWHALMGVVCIRDYLRKIHGVDVVATMAVRQVECWPGHNDPKSLHVEEDAP